jgi:acyl-CoA thioesterase-1
MAKAPQGYAIGASKGVGRVALPALALACIAACGASGPRDAAQPPPPTSVATLSPDPEPDRAPGPSPAARLQAAVDERPRILFLGTSLTAGLGLDPGQAYPALIQRKLDVEGLAYQAVNAGVSGETSAGALRRIDWVLRQPVAVLVVETGANDGLRGQDPPVTRENIRQILARAREAQPPPKLLLLGMQALPNYGSAYRRVFEAIYPELAREAGAAFVPFLLEGVAGVSALNQADGIHPTAEGQERIAETVWATLRPMLVTGGPRRPAARP